MNNTTLKKVGVIIALAASAFCILNLIVKAVDGETLTWFNWLAAVTGMLNFVLIPINLRK